jgi:hypothetical protein
VAHRPSALFTAGHAEELIATYQQHAQFLALKSNGAILWFAYLAAKQRYVCNWPGADLPLRGALSPSLTLSGPHLLIAQTSA